MNPNLETLIQEKQGELDKLTDEWHLEDLMGERESRAGKDLFAFVESSTTEAYVLGKSDTLKEVARVIEKFIAQTRGGSVRSVPKRALDDLSKALGLAKESI